MNTIELNSRNYRDYLPLDIAAFDFALAGAMGDPGGVNIITRNCESYYFNYRQGDLEWNQVEEIIPIISKTKIPQFGVAKFIPEGWHHLSLGAGNNLLIKEKYVEPIKREWEYLQTTKEEYPLLYGAWQDLMTKILKGKHYNRARVLISYKRADKEEVFRLKEKIEVAIGESCWIDVKDIESDAQFVNVIMQAIDDAEIILFMYSKEHSCIKNYEKDWTVREINYAQAEDKRIVFVNIDQTPLTKWFKFMFGLKQQIDATSEEAFGKLLEDLKGWLEVEDEPEAVEKSAPIEQKMPEPEPIQEPEPKPIEKEPYTEGLEYEFDDKNLTATVKGIGKAKGDRINIPPVVEHDGRKYSVTVIGGFAFEDCHSLTSVTIPDSVKEIESHAFENCRSLTSISIPNNVREIGLDAFSGCSSLTSVTIPNSVSVIRSGVFLNCSNLSSVNIPDSVTEIEPEAFMGCVSLTSVNIPDSVTEIGLEAFEFCSSLTSVTIPNSVTVIRPGAFLECSSLRSVEISSETKVEKNAFPETCKVKSRWFG